MYEIASGVTPTALNVNSQVLASKFYGLYSLLRELLSKQMHYDWGLRAVKVHKCLVHIVLGSFSADISCVMVV